MIPNLFVALCARICWVAQAIADREQFRRKISSFVKKNLIPPPLLSPGSPTRRPRAETAETWGLIFGANCLLFGQIVFYALLDPMGVAKASPHRFLAGIGPTGVVTRQQWEHGSLFRLVWIRWTR